MEMSDIHFGRKQQLTGTEVRPVNFGQAFSNAKKLTDNTDVSFAQALTLFGSMTPATSQVIFARETQKSMDNLNAPGRKGSRQPDNNSSHGGT